MSIITSLHNPLIKTAGQLLNNARIRKKRKQTVLEGVHLIDSLLHANNQPQHLIVAENYTHFAEINAILNKCAITPTVISQSCYRQLSTLGEGVPIMAIIEVAQLMPKSIHSDCLIINGIQDNGNLGTILRTAAATGFTTILCTHNTAQSWAPKTLRAGMGAHFSLKIYENLSIDDIFFHVKVPLFATSSHKGDNIFKQSLPAPLALILGNEGFGVDPQFISNVQGLSLPQLGQESLNVAVAGSVCLYEILRKRIC